MIKKELINQFGLVGKNIDYSFSREYFTSKFKNEKKVDYRYVNYDITSIDKFKEVITIKPIPMIGAVGAHVESKPPKIKRLI